MHRDLSVLWSLALGLLASCASDVPGSESGGFETSEVALTETLPGDGPAGVDEPSAAHKVLIASVTTDCDELCVVRQWIDLERYEEVYDVLSGTLQAAPQNVERALLLIEAVMRDELFERALELTDQLVPLVSDIRVLEKRAVASLLSHDVETAAHDFTETIQALQALPPGAQGSICEALTGRCASPLQREAFAWLGLANAEFNRRNLARATQILDDLSHAREFAGTFEPAVVQFMRALIASKQGDDTAARLYYEAILHRFPNDPASLVNLGGIAYRAGDLSASRELQTRAFEHAGRHRRTAAIAWSNVAELDLLEGKHADALQKAEEAVTLSRRFAGGYFQLAVIHDILGNVDAARRAMAQALSIDVFGVARWNMSMYSADWDTHFAGLIAEAQGRTESAQRAWQSLLDSDEVRLRTVARQHLFTARPR